MTDELILACPFRKQTFNDWITTGNGNPVIRESSEDFMPCLKEECAVYNTFSKQCSFNMNNDYLFRSTI